MRILALLLLSFSTLAADISLVNVGSASNDGTGDSIRTAFSKMNTNVTVLSDTSSRSVTATGSSTARSLATRFAEHINVMDFGATGDGTTDDSEAIQDAIDAAAGRPVYFPKGTYRVQTAITISGGVNIYGTGKILAVGNINTFVLSSFDQGSFDGLTFDSTWTGSNITSAIYGSNNNLSDITIRNCRFLRNNILLHDATLDTTASNANIVIENCLFTGDYTGAVYGSDVANVMDIRGFDGVMIEGNTFDVTGPERFLKISGSCRNVVITGNTFKSTSTSGKQAIDLFSDGHYVNVSNNLFNLTGSWTAVVEEKTGDNNPDYGEPREMLVQGNYVNASVTGNFTGIAFYGSWGLTSQVYTASSTTVANNIIKSSAPSSAYPIITVRGMTAANITGNTLDIADSLSYQAAINCDNNQSSVVSNNNIRNGMIQIYGAASHPNGTTYTNSPKQLIVSGNSVYGFKHVGAIYIASCTGLTNATIVGNNLRVGSAFSGSTGLISIYDGNTIQQLSIVGNSGTTDSRYTFYSTNSVTITSKIESGNGWQTSAGTSGYLAKWGSDGLSLGDSLISISGTQIGFGTTTYAGKWNFFDGGDMYFGDTGANARRIYLRYSNNNVGGIGTDGQSLSFFGGPSARSDMQVLTNGNVLIAKKLQLTTACGTATLSSGFVRVTNTNITTSTRIILTTQTPGGTVGTPYVSGRTGGASFDISSTSGSDTSTVAWVAIDP